MRTGVAIHRRLESYAHGEQARPNTAGFRVAESRWTMAGKLGFALSDSPLNLNGSTSQLDGLKMTRIQYHGPPTAELLEKMRRATAIYVYYSTEDQEEAWSSNKGVPRWSRPGSDSHKIECLELIVDSSKQLPEVQALWDAS
jgi:hypothetical protein